MRRAEPCEERIAHRASLHESLGTQVAVRHHRLGTALCDDTLQTGCDVVERLIPCDRLERAGSFRPGAAQRVQQPLGVIRPVLQEVVDLGAETAPRERVIGIALQLHRPPVPHGHGPRAGIGAIVRTRASRHPQRQLGDRHARSLIRRSGRRVGSAGSRAGESYRERRKTRRRPAGLVVRSAFLRDPLQEQVTTLGFRVVRHRGRLLRQPRHRRGPGDRLRRAGRIVHGSSSRRRRITGTGPARPVTSTCRPFRVAKVSGSS